MYICRPPLVCARNVFRLPFYLGHFPVSVSYSILVRTKERKKENDATSKNHIFSYIHLLRGHPATPDLCATHGLGNRQKHPWVVPQLIFTLRAARHCVPPWQYFSPITLSPLIHSITVCRPHTPESQR